MRGGYMGPPERPAWVHEYYQPSDSYGAFTEETIEQGMSITLKRIQIESTAGDIVIDYYQRAEKSDTLILVFPVLGGRKNMISSHFAETFARRGIDTAIIHRGKDFKNPEHVDRLEELFHKTVVRDRLALDFFEDHYEKKRFGAFGISRGAINVAISAGVDPRLEFNVMALGGTSLVQLFAKSKERRIKKYRELVKAQKQISGEQFIELLEKQLKTEPRHLAHYIDARKSLIFLSLFDKSVPIRFGRELREQIGKPKTIYLLADHRTSLLYTQFIPLFPPIKCFGLLPLDYIETESMAFFDKSFETGAYSPKHFLFTVMQVPFMLAESLISLF